MSTSTFPVTAIDTPTNPTATNFTNSPSLSAGQTLQNDAIVAIETKIGIDSSAVTSTLDYKLKSTSSLDPGHLHSANGLNAALLSGWFEPTETWTYVSSVSFTVPTDLTLRFQAGDKIRWKQGGSYKYGWVKTATYSAPNTTVTTIGFSSYTFASATITNNGYSKMEFPAGFPSLDTFNARAYRNSAATVSTGSIQKINYDTTAFNTGTFFDVVTNNRFNVPVDGYYQVTVTNQIAALTAAHRIGAYIYKNGSEDAENLSADSATLTISSTCTALLKCAAGDYLEGFVFQDSGGTLSLDNDPRQTYISIAFIRLSLS